MCTTSNEINDKMPLSDINGNIPTMNSHETAYVMNSSDGDGHLETYGYNGIDLDRVPISVARPKSRDLLCLHLKNIKVILSEEGYPRDWRGVLDCISLPNVNTTHFADMQDPFRAVLEYWIRERRDFATMGKLHNILGKIDRWDVVDDTRDFFRKYTNGSACVSIYM